MLESSAEALRISLHPKQWDAFLSPATEILYGGAAGGGKSYLMRQAAIAWCSEIPGLQVYLFRRIREDLVKNHVEGPSGFRELLAGWVNCGFVVIVEDEIRFWNGSKIYLCHCKDEKDRIKYQGAEIHVLLIDELTHFTDVIYRFLRNRVRMVGISVPGKYRGKFPRIVCGSNPGGIGHQFVKTTFIDNRMPMAIDKVEPTEGGMLRQYIPALLEDNPSMADEDPEYEQRLRGLGSDALVRAMRYGDWDVVEGAFFDCWAPHRHILEPFEIPEDWARFRSGDWGSAKPFSFGWWAIVEDDTRHPVSGQLMPRGSIIRYREWYGCVPGKPNTGLKLTAEQVGAGIAELETEKVAGGVLDPAAFAEDGGPSLANRIMAGSGAKKVMFRRADNKRVTQRGAMGGWDMMRQRMIGTDEAPMIFCFSTCRDSIRTIPMLQHDQDRPEDLDSDMEDHAADEWRYACMSRPWVKDKAVESPKRFTDYRARDTAAADNDWMTY
jgi:hypothetical protein